MSVVSLLLHEAKPGTSVNIYDIITNERGISGLYYDQINTILRTCFIFAKQSR